MQSLEVSGAVRLISKSLGVKGLMRGNEYHKDYKYKLVFRPQYFHKVLSRMLSVIHGHG